MKYFTRNLDKKGRLVRGLIALAMLLSGACLFEDSIWAGAILLLSGAFVAFEALRGWCVFRACGLKTKF